MNKILTSLKICILTILIVGVTQCSKDDSEAVPIPTGRIKSYTVRNTDLSDISGTVTFVENENNSTTINLVLQNTDEEIANAIDLRFQTANVGGAIAANLNPLDKVTGASSTVISKLNDGQNISYDQLLDFRGYIAIALSNQNTAELAAYCDIGPNEPTGKKITYALFSTLDASQNGFAIFEERKKGTASLMVNIFEYDANASYPAHIIDAETNSSNTVLIELPPVKGEFYGNSFSELTEINGMEISYDGLQQINATLEVFGDLDSDMVISRGGIGSNPQAQID